MSLRTVMATHPALRDDIGDLRTRRPLPGPGLERLGAFLFLNHHGPQVYGPNNNGLPFGSHPHRGFETVTFILQGELAHQDSAGHESVIRAGGVQWMTAGRGLVHSEVSPEAFRRAGGPLEILQLWINLPARHKMAEPRYVGLQKRDVPAIATQDGGAVVNLIAGAFGGREGPVESLTGVFMTTVELKPGGAVRFDGLTGRDVFLYVVRGEIRIGERSVGAERLVELSPHEEAIEITSREGATLLFGHADPIDEPVVAHGPFVMNSREEIMEAYSDYRAGKFNVSLA